MNHDAIRDMVFRLYDGELSPLETRETEAHLAGCPACRAALDEWKAVAGQFFSKTDPRPSDSFAAKVMARVRAERAPAAGWRRYMPEWIARRPVLLPWAGAAFAGAAAAMLAVTYLKPSPAAQSTAVYLMADADAGPAILAGAETDAAEARSSMGTSIEDYLL